MAPWPAGRSRRLTIRGRSGPGGLDAAGGQEKLLPRWGGIVGCRGVRTLSNGLAQKEYIAKGDSGPSSKSSENGGRLKQATRQVQERVKAEGQEASEQNS